LAFGGDEIARASLVIQANIDERQVEAAATRAAQAFDRQFARVQGRFASQAQQAAAAENLGRVFSGVAANVRVLNSEMVRLQRGIESAASATRGISIGFALVATAVGAAAIKIGKSFAGTAGSFQELRQSLNAIIRSSETANTTTDEFIGSLRRLAVQSGRSSQILANTGRQFLALGFSGDKAVEVLTAFTKAASLTGASNEQLRLALNGVAQIASKGAVAMEELRRQIAENLPGAINLARFFEILGEQMGITAAEARKLQEQGKITAEQGIPALIATVNEAIGDIDVFALRLNTLSGAVGALREIFTQAVEDGFQPFIEALLGASGPLRTLLLDFRENSDALRGVIERLGVALGTSFADILRQIIPLIPPLIDTFVTLVEALAPIIAQIVKIGAGFATTLIPAFQTAAHVISILVNELGPLSTAFKALTAALLVAGAVNALQTFGRTVLSSTGLVGSLSRAIITLGADSTVAAGGVGILRGALTLLTSHPIIAGLTILATQIPRINDSIKEGGIKGFLKDITIGRDKQHGLDRLFGKDVQDSIKKTSTALDEIAKKISETLPASFTEANAALTPLVEGLDKIQEAGKNVTEAQKGLTSANQALASATQTLRDLEAERLVIVNDSARDVRELAEAEEDLTRVRFKLRDLDEEEADILEKLAELRTPASARDLAAADRDVERATIALNKAKRDEAALLKGLNKDQKESVNLEGLSLDQIRAKLANIRATNAARKKEESGEKTLEEQQTEARLNVADAEDTLNKAKEARNLLDDKVKNNAEAIRELEERLVSLSLDRAGALRDEGVAQDALNTLRSGETGRAIELREIDKEIKAAKEGQKTATEGVRDATLEVRDAEREQKQIVAEIKGDQETINKLLLDRIGLNQTLIAQNPALLKGTVDQLVAELFKGMGGEAFGFTQADLANPIADALLNNPNALLDILRRFGFKAAEGAVVTKPGIWNLGEGYKPEIVLPLTKPDRVWQLLSQTLPKYPGALAAAQQAIQPTIRPTIQLPRGSGGNRPGAGPMTADQADEIIRLLKANGKSQVTVEAPVQIMSPVQDAEALARKVAQRVERSLARGL
jgi:tape measure domain-containing protein